MPPATYAPFYGNWPRKAFIGNCEVSPGVESAPPLLGCIKAVLLWKTCDSVFCVRGAKRNPIHTSLTHCALKMLLSSRHTSLQRETGARRAFTPKCLHFIAGRVSFQTGRQEQKTEQAMYCSKHLCFWHNIFFFLKLKPHNGDTVGMGRFEILMVS